MSEPSRGGRRRSSRLEDKEDTPLINGIIHDSEPVKGRQNTTGKQAKGNVNVAGANPAAKRKGERPRTPWWRKRLFLELRLGATELDGAPENPTDWFYSGR